MTLPKELSAQNRSIAIDIDGVIADQIAPILKIVDNRYGLTFQYEDVTDFSFENCLGLPKGANKLLIDEYNNHYLKSAKMIRHADIGLNYIFQNFYAQIVTSRNDPKGATATWLKNNLLRYHTLEFVSHQNKADRYEELQPILVIEDAPDIAIETAKRNLQVALVNAPWNQNVAHPNIFRIENLKDVIRLVK